jgi:hypothetical protein
VIFAPQEHQSATSIGLISGSSRPGTAGVRFRKASNATWGPYGPHRGENSMSARAPTRSPRARVRAGALSARVGLRVGEQVEAAIPPRAGEGARHPHGSPQGGRRARCSGCGRSWRRQRRPGPPERSDGRCRTNDGAPLDLHIAKNRAGPAERRCDSARVPDFRGSTRSPCAHGGALRARATLDAPRRRDHEDLGARHDPRPQPPCHGARRRGAAIWKGAARWCPEPEEFQRAGCGAMGAL